MELRVEVFPEIDIPGESGVSRVVPGSTDPGASLNRGPLWGPPWGAIKITTSQEQGPKKIEDKGRFEIKTLFGVGFVLDRAQFSKNGQGVIFRNAL